MKVMTILGTRPEIIRLSLIIKKLDKYCDHILVYTGQNYDDSLNKIFFEDLAIREPQFRLEVKSDTFGEQIGKLFTESEKVIAKIRPDAILILGDTNSGLVSIVAKRMHIPVFHMEAGNRCFDNGVPEEINRRVIDHSSTILLPYTHQSKEHLLREGIEMNRIYVIGNPIYEVLNAYMKQTDKSMIHSKLKIKPRKYFLVTTHREETVDNKQRLSNLLSAIEAMRIKYKLPIICSLHPRTKDRMERFNLHLKNKDIRFLTPLGFFDFVALEKKAFCVVTDSGTVQEECCIFNVPNVTVRNVTERPETLEAGSNIITGNEPDKILNCIRVALSETTDWKIPGEYQIKNVSSIVVKLIAGVNRIAVFS